MPIPTAFSSAYQSGGQRHQVHSVDGAVMVQACVVDADPSSVYISVTDTGRGISPESKALIFERLYQDADARR